MQKNKIETQKRRIRKLNAFSEETKSEFLNKKRIKLATYIVHEYGIGLAVRSLFYSAEEIETFLEENAVSNDPFMNR